MLRYFLDVPSPLKRYILNFLLSMAGYPARETSSAGEADLIYGTSLRSGSQILIPERPANLETLDCLHSLPPVTDNAFPFDIVAVVAGYLTDQVNSHTQAAYDEHQRLRFSSSCQARSGDPSLPVINVYTEQFKDWLAPRFGPGIPLWPEGKSAAIGLSHDVDRFDRWAEVRGTFRTGRYGRIAGRSLVRNLLRPHDDLRLLRELVDYETALGFKSTLMFAARSRFDPSASALDLPYSIRDPKVRSAMRYVLEQGCEVGLHASYNAYKDVKMFEEEKSQLAEACGAEIHGLRHHFWHTGKDVEHTLALHDAAHFTYDSSLAWNERHGFRRSVALPYYPWNSSQQAPVRVLQLPVAAMDGNFFYRRGMTAQLAGQELEKLTEVVLKHSGLGVIDWHSDTSHPATPNYREWGTAYYQYMQFLSRESKLWVASLGEIATWIKRRERLLASAEEPASRYS